MNYRLVQNVEGHFVVSKVCLMNEPVKIGDKFFDNSKKHRPIAKVVDCLTTTNSSGEVVRVRYLAAREFLGQTLSFEVCGTTVLRNRAKQ